MSNLYYQYKPSKYQLRKYLGKGKYGGLVYEVVTGSVDGDNGSGDTSELMILLTQEEYQNLALNKKSKCKLRGVEHDRITTTLHSKNCRHSAYVKEAKPTCKTTGWPCCRCQPGSCEHRSDG